MSLEEFQARLADFLAPSPEVLLVYLFGSQVLGPVGPASDVDMAVLLDRQADTPERRGALSHTLAAQFPGPALDVIFLNTASIELAFAVISQGVPLYQRDAASRVEYEARIMSLYGDYLPVLRQQRREMLAGGDVPPEFSGIERRLSELSERLARLDRSRQKPGISSTGTRLLDFGRPEPYQILRG